MKNLAALLKEAEDRKVDISYMPAFFYIETVKGCPYSCAMCQWHYTKHQSISETLLDKLSIYFNNLEALAIQGAGEPLLGDIHYFVAESIKYNFVLHINTTGFYLTHEISDLLLKARLSIRFSIHAGKAETYHKIMGNKLENVIKNIEYLLNKDKENDNNSDFVFSFIVMKENINEIPEFLFMTHALGVRSVRFMELEPNPRTVVGIRMSDRDFKFNYFAQNNSQVVKLFEEKLPIYQKLCSELGILIGPGSMTTPEKNFHRIQKLTNAVVRQLSPRMAFFPLKNRCGMCLAPWLGQLIIRQNGDVRLCCPCNYIVGNIYDSTLEEIWKGVKMKQIRQSFNAGLFPKMCGYCPGLEFNEYKNIFHAGISKSKVNH